MESKNILLAGATGYLGHYLAKELQNRGFKLTVILRDKKKLLSKNIVADKVYEGDLSDPNFYTSVMDGIDVVISTIGITRQKDGKTYMDIDYGVNHLLLQEALKSGVKKFIYTSVLHGEKLKHLKICEAKERFVEELQSSAIESLVIRPSGFFSDLEEILAAAKQGKSYLFGDGEKKLNPIHGADLASVIVNAIDIAKDTLEVGGPEVLTQNQIVSMAYEVLKKEARIVHIPNFVKKIVLSLLYTFTTQKTYGPIEFFLTVIDLDMECEKFGTKTLREHFKTLS